MLRWTVGTQTDLILSVMWSVPYNRQLWNPWLAVGLTNSSLSYDQACDVLRRCDCEFLNSRGKETNSCKSNTSYSIYFNE